MAQQVADPNKLLLNRGSFVFLFSGTCEVGKALQICLNPAYIATGTGTAVVNETDLAL